MIDARSDAWRPLSGIKIADFSMLLPGPLTTVVLADLGADVVKIEPPGGDGARAMLPTVFAAVNRNKRAVTLDLKNPDDRAHIDRLTRWADVVIEGFRPGVAQRLGIGFDDLIALNPRLVYCSLSGYGQDGPWRDKPGHDLNYLSAAGALAFPGSWGGKPSRSSIPIADIASAGWASSAILAALRERDQTGCGAYLDLSLFEATLFCTALRHGLEDSTDPTGHLFPGNDLFQAADGVQISLGLLEDRFWRAFCDIAGEASGLHDERFATVSGRRAHGDEITDRLHQIVAQRSAAQWAGLLEGSDVPFEICVSPARAAQSPHVTARRRVAERDGQRFVPFPVTVNGHARPAVARCAPDPGQHTAEFLQELAHCGGKSA